MILTLTTPSGVIEVATDKVLYFYVDAMGDAYAVISFTEFNTQIIAITEDPTTFTLSAEAFAEFPHADYTYLLVNCSRVMQLDDLTTKTAMLFLPSVAYGTTLQIDDVIADVTALVNESTSHDRAIAYYTMQANASPTAILNTSDYYKAEGATTQQPPIYLFDLTGVDNSATYTGLITRYIKSTAILTLSSSNNNQIAVVFTLNGTPVASSEIIITCDGAGRNENAKMQAVISCSTSDVIEVWVRNMSATNDIVVEDLSVIHHAIT